jgi:hypothetical protein
MNKKIFVFLILLLVVSFGSQAFASLTFTTDAITGTAASTIDIGAGNTLSLQTTGNAPITTGTGLVTTGGNLSITGNTSIGGRLALHGRPSLPYYGMDGIWEVNSDLGQANGYTSGYFSFEPSVPQALTNAGSYMTGGDFSFWGRDGYTPYVNAIYQGLTATAAWESSTASGNKIARMTAIEGADFISQGSVNVANASVAYLSLVHFGSGLIDNAYGIQINAPITGGAGSPITNSYGLYLGEQATTGIVNPWQIYSAGTAPSYFAGKIGIGTATPGTSSILDISSTTKGVVLPRMTQAQRNAIATPVAGMVIYQIDAVPGLRAYNGTNWMRFTETAD